MWHSTKIPVLRHCLIFVEFAEELTQNPQYSFHWRHGHRKVLLSSRLLCNSSTGLKRQAVHILPQRCLLDLHPNLQQRKVICPYFHVWEAGSSLYLLGSSGCASVVILVEGDLLLYQSSAPPPVKNLRLPLQRQLHSFFFVFEHKLTLMLCHQIRDNKAVFHWKLYSKIFSASLFSTRR